jgi:hypothetical protein
MISQKQRSEMIEQAGEVMAMNNGEEFEGFMAEAFMEDAKSCLTIFEPVFMIEVQTLHAKLTEEMDRLIEENERLADRVSYLEAQI